MFNVARKCEDAKRNTLGKETWNPQMTTNANFLNSWNFLRVLRRVLNEFRISMGIYPIPHFPPPQNPSYFLSLYSPLLLYVNLSSNKPLCVIIINCHLGNMNIQCDCDTLWKFRSVISFFARGKTRVCRCYAWWPHHHQQNSQEKF